MRTTKVSKRMIEDLINNLEELVMEMEERNINEIETESNTYFCRGSNFISFTGIGYLPIEEDYYDMLEENEEEED